MLDQDDAEVSGDAVFVIDSINEKYASAKMSTLLASEDLKEEYDYVFNTVALKRDVLLKSMKKKRVLQRISNSHLATW